jgi:hypothetical protein
MVGRMVPHPPLKNGAWRTNLPTQRRPSSERAYGAAYSPEIPGQKFGPQNTRKTRNSIRRSETAVVGRMVPHPPLRNSAWRTNFPTQRCAPPSERAYGAVYSPGIPKQRCGSSFILHPSSFILHPSSFIIHSTTPPLTLPQPQIRHSGNEKVGTFFHFFPPRNRFPRTFFHFPTSGNRFPGTFFHFLRGKIGSIRACLPLHPFGPAPFRHFSFLLSNVCFSLLPSPITNNSSPHSFPSPSTFPCY